ncbi:MAG: hypothetical protein WA151_11315 [Desulfatirhabdiaceae bacterium]
MDFAYRNIEIRASTDNWGPWPFDITNAIPAGESIQSVSVAAYAGKVTPDDATLVGSTLTFTGKTAIGLIDTDYAPVISGAEVRVKLKYPGGVYKGTATLVFDVTLVGTGKFPFFFDGIKIK